MDDEERREREGTEPSRERPAAPDEPATAFPVGEEARRGGNGGPIIEREPEEPEPTTPPIAEPEPERPIAEPEPQGPIAEPEPIIEPEPDIPIAEPEPDIPIAELEPDEDERSAY
jgi:hypothetical protein